MDRRRRANVAHGDPINKPFPTRGQYVYNEYLEEEDNYELSRLKCSIEINGMAVI